MKASVSIWNYSSYIDDGEIDVLGAVDEIKALGADGVEVFGPHLDADNLAAEVKAVAEKARGLGLDISSLIAANHFARPAAAERAEQVDGMKRMIEAAAGAGIDRLNTFTGYHIDGADPVLEAYRVVDSYREVMPAAEAAGVLLCIENHSSVCRDADGLMWIIRQVGSPNLKTNPDFTNFVRDFRVRGDRAKEAIYTETARVMPLAASTHLKIGDFTPDGDHAHVDMPRLMGLLTDAGFDGHVVLEVYDGDRREACAKGVALLRKYM